MHHTASIPPSTRRTRWRRVLSTALWLGLLALFVARFGPEILEAAASIRPLGLAVAIALCLFAAWTVAASLAWRALLGAALPGRSDVPKLTRLIALRVQAQALNFIVPSAGLLGESARAVSAVQTRSALNGSVAAVVLDNFATTVAGLAFSAAALPMLLVVTDNSWQLGMSASLVLAILALAASGAPFVLAPRLCRAVAPDGRLGRFLQVFRDRAELRGAFRRAVGWHLVERLVSVGEVHVVMWSLGVPATIGDSVIIAAVFILMSFAVFFVPAQLGAAELGVTMAAVALGFSPAVGVSIALVRRARQLLVCVAGLGLLAAGRSPRWIGAHPLRSPDAPNLRPACVGIPRATGVHK